MVSRKGCKCWATSSSPFKKNKRMSQNSEILKYLQKGKTLTGLQGLEKFGTMKLATRISELKAQGHKIKSETITVGKEKKRVSKYFIK